MDLLSAVFLVGELVVLGLAVYGITEYIHSVLSRKKWKITELLWTIRGLRIPILTYEKMLPGIRIKKSFGHTYMLLKTNSGSLYPFTNPGLLLFTYAMEEK